MELPACPPKKSIFGIPYVLFLLFLMNVLTESVLQLGDRGLFEGLPPLRNWIYALGAFQPNLNALQSHHFAGQSLSMFLTYGFLHTGFYHLMMNMIGMVWLGKLILSYRSSETFLMLYFISMVGAAQAYLLINTQNGIMIGASGAVFGLLGVYIIDSGLLQSRRPTPEESAVQFFRASLVTVLLVFAEIGSQLLLGGDRMAWQAHAGGFITGAVVALLTPPRFRTNQ